MTSSDLFLQERKILSVLPAAYIDRPYSYAVPEHIKSPLQKGSIVHIPLNNRLAPGVVWDTKPGEMKKTAKLKEIASALEARPLTTQHLEFIQRLADYTLSPLGAVLKMTLSSPHIFEEEPEITVYSAILQDEMPSLSEKHQRVLSFLLEHGPHIAAEIAEAANVSTALLKTMVKNGVIKKESLLPSPPCHAPDPTRGQRPDAAISRSDAQGKGNRRLQRRPDRCRHLQRVRAPDAVRLGRGLPPPDHQEIAFAEHHPRAAVVS